MIIDGFTISFKILKKIKFNNFSQCFKSQLQSRDPIDHFLRKRANIHQAKYRKVKRTNQSINASINNIEVEFRKFKC